MPATLAALVAHVDGWGHHDGGWMWSGWLLMAGFGVAMIAAAVWLLVRCDEHTPHPDDADRTRGTLAKRYAGGEPTTDEYHEPMDALR